MFTLPLTLPSTRKVRVPELKNKHFFIIQKFCTNDDLEGLSIYFKKLLFEEFNLPRDLNFIDIAYILIYLRAVFISPKIYISNNAKKEISVDLSIFLEKLENLNFYGLKQVSHNNIKCSLGLPSEIYFTDIDEVLISTLYSIEYNDTSIDVTDARYCPPTSINFKTLSADQQNNIINNLPAIFLEKILDHIKEVNAQLGKILVIEENVVFDIKEVDLELASNQLFTFIKAIYSHDLRSFFELMYHYNNKVVHDSSLFMELTPVDTHILLNFYKDEIKTQNEELKKSRQ